MLNIKTIDAGMLSRMFLAGAKNLEAKKEWINELKFARQAKYRNRRTDELYNQNNPYM